MKCGALRHPALLLIQKQIFYTGLEEPKEGLALEEKILAEMIKQQAAEFFMTETKEIVDKMKKGLPTWPVE